MKKANRKQESKKNYQRQIKNAKAIIKALEESLVENTDESWGNFCDLQEMNNDLLRCLMIVTKKNNPAKVAYENESEEKGKELLLKQALRNSNRYKVTNRNGDLVTVTIPE